MNTPRIMLIAGEASGDTLGAELVRSLRAVLSGNQAVTFAPEFIGAGGPLMAAAGVKLSFDLAEHAVVGIVEVLKNYGKFKRFFDQLLDLACDRQPDVIILIDYPGFNLRFAQALRKRVHQQAAFHDWKPKIVFYVSPQLWAWHASRVYQIARDMDLLLAIFPFEPAWYAERVPDFPVRFVGHPLVDRFGPRLAMRPDALSGEPRVLLLPGSRVRELKRHIPVLLKAIGILKARGPVSIKMVLPNERLRALAVSLGAGDVPIQIGKLSEALKDADLALASSGTVTMECAFFGVPTVVIYKTSWSTYWLGRYFIKVPYIAMPNLLAGQAICPEFIQGAATPEAIASAASELLNNKELRAVTKAKLLQVIESLGQPGASRRAAEAIAGLIEM